MPINPPHSPSKIDFAHDLLRGAEQISEFLYGDPGHRRKVYHLAETSRLPIFRLGSLLCARRSVLLAWITQQEGRGWPSAATETTASTDITTHAGLGATKHRAASPGSTDVDNAIFQPRQSSRES